MLLKNVEVNKTITLVNSALGTQSGLSASYNTRHEAGTILRVVRHNTKSTVCQDVNSYDYRFKPDTEVTVEVA